jgi:hypothetical protein
MNARQIRAWLLIQPRAAQLRLTCTGKAQVVPVGNQTWAQVAASVEAMGPELIEALDVMGNTVRAVRPQDVDDEGDAEPAAPAPAPAVLDAESARFTLVATLLAEAHAASFNALIAICQSNQQRAESLERTAAQYERQRRQELDDREDALLEKEEASGQNPLKQLAETFMGGMQNGAAAPAPAPKSTNGKA